MSQFRDRKISFPPFSCFESFTRHWVQTRPGREEAVSEHNGTDAHSTRVCSGSEQKRDAATERKTHDNNAPQKCPLAPLCALKDGHVQPQHQSRRKRGEGKCACMCVRARVCTLKDNHGGRREWREGRGDIGAAHTPPAACLEKLPFQHPGQRQPLYFSAGLTHTLTHSLTLTLTHTHTPSPARNQRATWWIFKVSALRRLTTGAERSTVSQESSCSRAELRSPSRGYISSSLLRIRFCFLHFKEKSQACVFPSLRGSSGHLQKCCWNTRGQVVRTPEISPGTARVKVRL